ncbi:MAG: IMP cyclohydrolase [candidate division WOR-3 bacterium]
MRGWAILSVWDKSGLEELARALVGADYGLLATSKTGEVLRGAGFNVTDVAQWTGAPEVLKGRVKTLHPKIAAGILSFRDDKMIEPIDFVVCNLYPFADGLRQGLGLKEMIELIDIGGVTLLRAAAKNWLYVTAVPEPKYYPEVIAELRSHGEVSRGQRLRLAQATFELTSRYDGMICSYFAEIVDRYPDFQV